MKNRMYHFSIDLPGYITIWIADMDGGNQNEWIIKAKCITGINFRNDNAQRVHLTSDADGPDEFDFDDNKDPGKEIAKFYKELTACILKVLKDPEYTDLNIEVDVDYNSMSIKVRSGIIMYINNYCDEVGIKNTDNLSWSEFAMRNSPKTYTALARLINPDKFLRTKNVGRKTLNGLRELFSDRDIEWK